MSNKNQTLKKGLMDDYPNTQNSFTSYHSVHTDSNYNTLNEGVFTSLKREFVRIFNKTQYVLLPRCSASSNTDLRNWDLWGPLVFTMLLSFFMSESKNNDEMSQTFVIVFVIMWIGGTVVTINSILLGAKVSIYQSICVLGYCLFPEVIASIIMCYLKNYLNQVVRVGIASGCFFWSSTSSISFMGDIVGQDKKFLAAYPVYLFYFFFSCYLLL